MFNTGYCSVKNTTYAALGGAGTYTGTWEDVSAYAAVCVACKADVAGTLYLEFSDNKDDSTADSSLAYDVDAGLNEVHRLSITRKWFRTRYVNGAGAQTTFSIQAMIGFYTALSAPSNLTIGADADATTVRALPSEVQLAQGLIGGYSVINKFGLNPAVSSGSVPEDIWGGGGVYTGFPTEDELVTVVSDNANDTLLGSGARTVRIYGLGTGGVEQNEDIDLAGLTLVDSVNTYTRVFRMYVIASGGSSNAAFNAGDIICAHKTTTANIFADILTGQGQSQTAAYTIPAGKTGYLELVEVTVSRANTVVIEGGLYIKENGLSPRIRRTFSLSNVTEHQDRPYGGLRLPALTDITIRITSCSANNVSIYGLFDIVLVDN